MLSSIWNEISRPSAVRTLPLAVKLLASYSSRNSCVSTTAPQLAPPWLAGGRFLSPAISLPASLSARSLAENTSTFLPLSNSIRRRMRVILGDSSVHASSSLSFSVLALCPLRLGLAPGGVLASAGNGAAITAGSARATVGSTDGLRWLLSRRPCCREKCAAAEMLMLSRCLLAISTLLPSFQRRRDSLRS